MVAPPPPAPNALSAVAGIRSEHGLGLGLGGDGDGLVVRGSAIKTRPPMRSTACGVIAEAQEEAQPAKVCGDRQTHGRARRVRQTRCCGVHAHR